MNTALGVILTVLALTVIYTRVGESITINSDNASVLLMADAFRHGNYLLHGWTITNCSFYITDLPLYVIAMAISGFTPALLHVVPAVIYALLVVSSVWLAGRGRERKASRLGMIVTFLLLGLPTAVLANIMLSSVSHVATTLFVVWGLLALDVAESSWPSARRLLLYTVISTLAVLSDIMAIAVGVLPILIISVTRLMRNKDSQKDEQQILVAAIASVLLGKALLLLIHSGGGFTIDAVPIIFTPLSRFSENVQSTVGGLLSLFRAYFFGNTFCVATAGKLINLSGFGLAMLTFYRAARAWQQRRTELDRVTEILTCAIAINLLSYLLNFKTIDMVNVIYSPPERYLVPCYIFLAILVGRYGVEWIANQRWLQAILAALTLVYGAFFIGQLRQPAYVPPTALLTAWLEANHLTYGYGSFWAANIVTVESRGQVKIRPVDGTSGVLSPLQWFSADQWYTEYPSNFVVFDFVTYHGKGFYWAEVNELTAQRRFGPASRMYQVGPYIVMIWDHDITPYPHPPARVPQGT